MLRMDVLRLTLRQLQIFVAVARSGSTTAASADIALSQSATSSAVNELERLLSLRLFDRAGKRLLLNDNGRALLPRALALLDGAAGIEQMSRDGSAQMQSLRVGASTTIGNYVLPKLLARFVAARPPGSAGDCRSKVIIANTAAICDAVAAFELDMGLIEGPCHQAALAVTPWAAGRAGGRGITHQRLGPRAATGPTGTAARAARTVVAAARSRFGHARSHRPRPAATPARLPAQHRVGQL